MVGLPISGCVWTKGGQCVFKVRISQNTLALDKQPNLFSDYDDADEEEEGDNDEVGRFFFDEHGEGEDGIEGKTSYLRGS